MCDTGEVAPSCRIESGDREQHALGFGADVANVLIGKQECIQRFAKRAEHRCLPGDEVDDYDHMIATLLISDVNERTLRRQPHPRIIGFQKVLLTATPRSS